METRRRFALVLAALAGGTALTSCNGPVIDEPTIEADITKIINQVQAGVAAGCSAIGKIVPQANSVLTLLQTIVSSTSVLAALSGVLTEASLVTQAVAFVVKQVCTAPAPTAAPGEVIQVDVNGKPVHIVIY